jgi:hypothetical protein
MLLHADLKVMWSDFEYVASQLASVSPEVFNKSLNVLLAVNHPHPRMRKSIFTGILKQVNGVASSVPGSSMAHSAIRNELHNKRRPPKLPSNHQSSRRL